MNIKEVFEFLRDGKYIVASKGKYNFTDKFYQEKGNPIIDRSGVMTRSDQEDDQMRRSRDNSEVILRTDPEAQRRTFINFIMMCKVPRRGQTNKGDEYDMNKYSEEGFKVFQQCIKDGVNIDLLIKSTTLYYASGSSYKKKIGNYLVDGDWRTDYLTLVEAAKDGEQALKDHITEELDNGEYSYIIL
jgi:hypothetical protein